MNGFLLVLMTLIWLTNENECSVLIADTTMTRMIELNADAPYCRIYYDRGLIQSKALSVDQKKFRQMSLPLVIDLEKACQQSLKNKNLLRWQQTIKLANAQKSSECNISNRTENNGFMYPGTKWCGPGNIAQSFEDLGQHFGEDRCCREHDRCPLSIKPGQCIHGICNRSSYMRSHCDCDAKFRRCLQNLNTEVANTLGALNFNVIQVICFKERRPCSQWQRVGYNESESEKLCSQFKFQPSEKYIPLMPLTI